MEVPSLGGGDEGHPQAQDPVGPAFLEAAKEVALLAFGAAPSPALEAALAVLVLVAPLLGRRRCQRLLGEEVAVAVAIARAPRDPLRVHGEARGDAAADPMADHSGSGRADHGRAERAAHASDDTA